MIIIIGWRLHFVKDRADHVAHPHETKWKQTNKRTNKQTDKETRKCANEGPSERTKIKQTTNKANKEKKRVNKRRKKKRKQASKQFRGSSRHDWKWRVKKDTVMMVIKRREKGNRDVVQMPSASWGASELNESGEMMVVVVVAVEWLPLNVRNIVTKVRK